MYKGKPYILKGFIFSPFFKPLPSEGAQFFVGQLYRDIFPEGFPEETDEDVPSVAYTITRSLFPDIKLEKIPPLRSSILEISQGKTLYDAPPTDSTQSSMGILSTIRKQTPPSISPVSPVPYVTAASQFPAVRTGFVPARYSDPQDFTSSKLY